MSTGKCNVYKPAALGEETTARSICISASLCIVTKWHESLEANQNSNSTRSNPLQLSSCLLPCCGGRHATFGAIYLGQMNKLPKNPHCTVVWEVGEASGFLWFVGDLLVWVLFFLVPGGLATWGQWRQDRRLEAKAVLDSHDCDATPNLGAINVEAKCEAYFWAARLPLREGQLPSRLLWNVIF